MLLNNVGKELFNNFSGEKERDDGGQRRISAHEFSCHARERPNNRLSQPVAPTPFSLVTARGLAVGQAQRSLLGTLRMTWSMWLPQPLQVVLRQYMQVVVRHMVFPSVDSEFHKYYTPRGIFANRTVLARIPP